MQIKFVANHHLSPFKLKELGRQKLKVYQHKEKEAVKMLAAGSITCGRHSDFYTEFVVLPAEVSIHILCTEDRHMLKLPILFFLS